AGLQHAALLQRLEDKGPFPELSHQQELFPQAVYPSPKGCRFQLRLGTHARLEPLDHEKDPFRTRALSSEMCRAWRPTCAGPGLAPVLAEDFVLLVSSLILPGRQTNCQYRATEIIDSSFRCAGPAGGPAVRFNLLGRSKVYLPVPVRSCGFSKLGPDFGCM